MLVSLYKYCFTKISDYPTALQKYLITLLLIASFLVFPSLSLEIYDLVHFGAAWSDRRGCKKARKSTCIPPAVHSGCTGISILCSCSNLHVDQRSSRAQRSTNLRGNFLAPAPDCNALSI